MMEDEERQKKVQAGKAKLAEYRQRKAQSDGQKKQKKKKKKAESEMEEQRRGDGDQTLSSVTHDQTYTIEHESEISTTAEDCSSEDEQSQQSESNMESDLQSGDPQSPIQIMQDELAAKNMAVEELSRELEEIRAAFGSDGVQQLQEALQQRDEIITQLTANLQQARAEKEEVMREFLELTDQSQKLQIQFQQLQAGEILRSSNISSTAADLLQARQQISLYQNQLEETIAQVSGHQEKTQEHLSLISHLQERLSEAEKVQTQAEESSAQSLREKDLLNVEQQRLISEHLQTEAQLQDQLLTSTQQLKDVNKHLAAKTQELENCERELSVSRQKEQMSSTEILQLMKTVEDLQQRCHQGSQSESKTIQIVEEDWTRRMDQLRAELDEMYGQQIVQMKEELRVQHVMDVDRIQEQHSAETQKVFLQHCSELERCKGQLSDSTGEVNVLNAKVIKLQQKLQESQAKRDKAEQELMQESTKQIEHLQQELQSLRTEVKMRSKSPDNSQMETQLLRDAISDLQAQLDAAQKITSDLEAKHESEVTNYKIKLDMLEREKDAVLGRMAESQEAELERLRTELLFSHEEELSRLRNDFQRESQLNGENLRDEMAIRHRQAVELLRMDFEDKLRSVENERSGLATERDALLQEIVTLKIDLNQRMESSHTEKLNIQLQELQTEVKDLKQRESVRRVKEEDWKKEKRELESENKILQETNAAMREELTYLKEDREILLQNTECLSSENNQVHARIKDLQAEIEKQKNTFSFAEKNFEVNYQELKDEYTCLVNTKVQLEERLIKEVMEYETKLRDLHVEPEGSALRSKTEDEEVNGKPLVEKDVTELMEKLKTSEKEKMTLTQRLSETVTQVTLLEADVKRLEEELKRDRDETVMRNQKLEPQPHSVEDCCVSSGSCSTESHHMHIRSLRQELEALKLSQLSAERERGCDQKRLCVLMQEKQAVEERLASCGGMHGDPSSQTAAQPQEGREREKPLSTTADALRSCTQTSAAARENLLAEPDGWPHQVKTDDPKDDGDSQCVIQDMETSEHDECRLQLEAQRISLSQIHAAQLELLRESLLAQMVVQLRSREQELQEAHTVELRHLQEQLRSAQQEIRGQPAELKEASVQQPQDEVKERLEERRRQEMEHMKTSCYQQREPCTEQSRLQELTRTEIFSMPSVCSPVRGAELSGHGEDEESLSVDADAELVTADLWYELQAVCEASRESSRQEPESVREAEEEQIRPHPEMHLGGFQAKHHQEQLEEEIAKVIVQLSVEFAQHTEQERVSKRARETNTTTQTGEEEMKRDEDSGLNSVTMAMPHIGTQSAGEDQILSTAENEQNRETSAEDEYHEEPFPVRLLGEEFSSELINQEEEHTCVLEALRASHTHQMEFLQEQNTNLIDQIHTLNQQLLQREQELVKERERDSQTYPSMQSISTQTDQTREEEDTGVRGHEDPMTSHSPAQEVSSDVIITERESLRQANVRLCQVLTDVLKTTAAAEETIGRHVKGILQASDASSESFHSSEIAADDVSMFSDMKTDEGPEMPQKGVELEQHEVELQLEREEYLMSISTRLQSAVEKLFIAISETTTQLEHARITQTELMREKFRHNEEIEELLLRQEELQERLNEEARAREQLALELHRAEGLIDGYTGERLALEQQVRERAELQLQLQQELHVTSSRLHELEQERRQILQERELLSRQQDAMKDGAESRELRLVEAALDAAPEADLLEETEKLMAEKVEVQRQAQKESSELQQQVKRLELELEEQVGRAREAEEARGVEGADLRQQILALEKQLEKNRKFIDEQAADREHERDVFQQEIQKLEEQLRNPLRTQSGSERRDREVQDLSRALQEKSDWCSELLLSSEQLQRDVQERDEEMETLGARVRELEHTLMHRVEEEQHVSMAGRGDVTLEAQLQTEREALDRKEKEILNLEEQLEQFREELENKSEEVNQLHMQLEIQRKEISSHHEDLQAQARLSQVLEEKDRQITVLKERISKLQPAGSGPEEELQVVEEKNEVLHELESQTELMRSEQERLKRNHEEEVEQLNAVIEKLQQELLVIEHKQPQEETSVGKDQYDEMKQKMDDVTKELDTLKTKHHSLLSKHEGLQEEASAGRHEETMAELEEALREKTAAFVVVQAQVQALEESASAKVMDMSRRIEDLEVRVEEKNSELQACRLKVEQVQNDADGLSQKVAHLEEKLREKMAVTQLGAIQTECEEVHAGDPTSEPNGRSVQSELEGLVVQNVASVAAPTGTVSLLMEKLKELEEGLSEMQKDQKLQKQLLCSSEEEVQEYEKRLGVLMGLLNQMRTRPIQHTPESSAQVSELLQELQEVKGEAASVREELRCYRELSHKLQEEIEMKDSTVAQLQMSLGQVSASAREGDTAEAEKRLQELQEVRGQVSSTQRELETSREQSIRLQELVQEREMSIALLKDQLHMASQKGDRPTVELLQELQEVKGEAASTKEELSSYMERSLKLQEQIEVRDVSIAQLKEEIQHLRAALSKSSNDSPQQPPSHPKMKGSKQGDNSGGKDTPQLPHQNSVPASKCYGPSRADVGTQADLPGADEVAEMIVSYTEKIGQMQELHAAEILDMEARHISESESLKRERQQLEEQCRALADVVHSVRSAEGPSVRSDRSAVSPFKDGYTSDSSSAWSSDAPHSQQENRTTPEGAHRDLESDLLPHRIKTLLREVHQEGMQVLSLSEMDHGENMSGLCSADRTSLLTEIHQLRAQINAQRHHVDITGSATERERVQVAESDSERLAPEELKTALSWTKLELENTLRSQDKLLKDLDALRAEVSLKTAELNSLQDTLADEQRKVRDLRWICEKDKCRADRKQEAGREEVEDLKMTLEEERARMLELSSSLEKERQTSAQLREQIDGQHVRSSSELQVQLEVQRSRVTELSSTLEREKDLNTRLIQQLKMSTTSAPQHHTLLQAEDTCSQVEAGVLSVESLLQTLQLQLDEKQAQVMQMMEKLERQKLDAVQRSQDFEEEKSLLARSAARDRDALRAAHECTAHLEKETVELRGELDTERESIQRLQRERERLQERVTQLEGSVRLMRVQAGGQCADETSSWVLQQDSSAQSSDPKHINNILKRLQLIAAKINNLMSEAAGRSSVEAPDCDSLTWLHNNVQDVMSLLQHVPSAPGALPESTAVLLGGSSGLLNERLLRQNAELTGFVSRLTEEKNDLRNQLLRVEGELYRYRQKNFNSVSGRDSALESVLLSSERDVWTQERNRLEKSLRQAETEVSRLRGEIRSEMLRDLSASDVENNALKKMYSRFLRAESFRKALIYQKKYLLLLLGGFQECEEATLSLIARMGGRPAHAGLEPLGHRRRGFTRFRSAVRVAVALSRMKFLVRRWQRAAGGVNTSLIVSRNSQITGADVRNESSHLHSGAVMFRERRAASGGFSGRDSPRSTVTVQQRYHSTAGESGGLPCSHLQNYDPDRALTDYISRLEALQRRLGSVQSGSSSCAQLHFGIRR